MRKSRADFPIPIMSFPKIHVKGLKQCYPIDVAEEKFLGTQTL